MCVLQLFFFLIVAHCNTLRYNTFCYSSHRFEYCSLVCDYILDGDIYSNQCRSLSARTETTITSIYSDKMNGAWENGATDLHCYFHFPISISPFRPFPLSDYSGFSCLFPNIRMNPPPRLRVDKDRLHFDLEIFLGLNLGEIYINSFPIRLSLPWALGKVPFHPSQF